jgi:hypothetical protein
MLMRHEGEIATFLTLVNDVGCGTVRASVLKSWFGLTNASKNIWRELYERWKDIGSCELLLVAESDGSYTFVYGRGLSVSSNDDETWLVDIRDWC